MNGYFMLAAKNGRCYSDNVGSGICTRTGSGQGSLHQSPSLARLLVSPCPQMSGRRAYAVRNRLRPVERSRGRGLIRQALFLWRPSSSWSATPIVTDMHRLFFRLWRKDGLCPQNKLSSVHSDHGFLPVVRKRRARRHLAQSAARYALSTCL